MHLKTDSFAHVADDSFILSLMELRSHSNLFIPSFMLKLRIISFTEEAICSHLVVSQPLRVISSSRALSLWFSCTSKTSLMVLCWKPISQNWASRNRNSEAWEKNKKLIQLLTIYQVDIFDVLNAKLVECLKR